LQCHDFSDVFGAVANQKSKNARMVGEAATTVNSTLNCSPAQQAYSAFAMEVSTPASLPYRRVFDAIIQQ
jgi:hypothetical protein